ncbi:hypothetical protein M011DRAFT_314917 [Sporormia fimetaria CBS 119925]|uniref:Ecp2 effector protein domain-containing protein n=1 Tax=Sporormia fimetaria CBS 119925 TaxID=1340428 RepID=A0A6A6UU87_9PLEO|nr:hypothetical protein M011DRAFT_314917 [Sporormia fimetaria CBS 119925]
MRLTAFSILGLVACSLAMAIPGSNERNVTSAFTRLTKRADGECTNLNLPTEEEYDRGVWTFCMHWDPDESHTSTDRFINRHRPVRWTIGITSYEGKILNWVYELWLNGMDRPMADQLITKEKCIRKMSEILSEGELGKQYCIVKGTETVLFQGGKFDELIQPWGSLNYESRLHGETGNPFPVEG